MKFDWDRGNWPKCGKHGLSKAEIEAVFETDPTLYADPDHSVEEQRYKAIGRTAEGRYVFVVVVFRLIEGELHIRPVSARHMHKKEIDHYVRSQA